MIRKVNEKVCKICANPKKDDTKVHHLSLLILVWGPILPENDYLQREEQVFGTEDDHDER